MNTRKVGVLIGQLMKELMQDEEFHAGYHEGIFAGKSALGILRAGHNMGNMRDEKVLAIKQYREDTGVGLKEAKDQVEKFMGLIEAGFSDSAILTKV